MNNFTLRLNADESGYLGLELHWDPDQVTVLDDPGAYVGLLHPADGSEPIIVIVQPVLG